VGGKHGPLGTGAMGQWEHKMLGDDCHLGARAAGQVQCASRARGGAGGLLVEVRLVGPPTEDGTQ
jgi:hypothetical protein